MTIPINRHLENIRDLVYETQSAEELFQYWTSECDCDLNILPFMGNYLDDLAQENDSFKRSTQFERFFEIWSKQYMSELVTEIWEKDTGKVSLNHANLRSSLLYQWTVRPSSPSTFYSLQIDEEETTPEYPRIHRVWHPQTSICSIKYLHGQKAIQFFIYTQLYYRDSSEQQVFTVAKQLSKISYHTLFSEVVSELKPGLLQVKNENFQSLLR